MQSNAATSKFCNKYGLVLDMKTAMEMCRTRDKIDMLIEKLVKNPEKLEVILILWN